MSSGWPIVSGWRVPSSTERVSWGAPTEISGTGAPRTLALAASFAYRTFRATEGGVDAGRVRRAS